MNKTNSKIDFNLYELMDRSFALHQMYIELLDAHEGLNNRPELEKLSLKVSTTLFEFYQKCASHWYAENPELYGKIKKIES